MPVVVLDASMTGAWCFPDEQTALTERIFDLLVASDIDVIAPALWAYEVRNTVLTGLRRGRITKRVGDDFLVKLARLNIKLLEPPSYEAIFALAEQHSLTFYDAAYLSSALLEKCSLASLDKALIRAATALDIEIFQPAGFFLQ